MVEQTIRIDLNRGKYRIAMSEQCDFNSRLLHVYLYQDSKPFYIEENAKAYVKYARSDGEIGVEECTISTDRLSVDISITGFMSYIAGDCKLELMIVSSDSQTYDEFIEWIKNREAGTTTQNGSVLHTMIFNLYVGKAVYSDDEVATQGRTQFAALENALSDVETVIDGFDVAMTEMLHSKNPVVYNTFTMYNKVNGGNKTRLLYADENGNLTVSGDVIDKNGYTLTDATQFIKKEYIDTEITES